jgi:tetratricopeptide (TPR) repeat protein
MLKKVIVLCISATAYLQAVDTTISQETPKKVLEQYDSAKSLIQKKKTTQTNIESDSTQGLGKFTKEKILVEYTKALNLYKQKAYQKAYESFNILFESNLDDVNINFYLGRSAFEIKKYNDAIIAFDRILFAKPDNNRVKLEIGRAYFMSKQYGEAKKYFKEVQKNPNTPKNIQDALEKFFLVIEQNTKKHFLNGVVLVGLNYDSNAKNTSDWITTTIPNTESKSKDIAHQEVMILNYKYKLNDLDSLKTDMMLFSKIYDDDEKLDNAIQLLSISPAYSKIYEGGVSVDYAIFADALRVDDDSDMRSYGIFPQVTYPLSKDKILNFYLKSQKKVFQDVADEAKNSWYNEFGMGVKYIYSPKVTFGGTVIASKEKENNDKTNTRVDVNKDSYQVKLNATYMVGQKFSLAPSVSTKKIKYKDQNTLNNNLKQEDNEYKIALIGTYVYSPKWLFQLGGDYTKTDSNLPASEYVKHTFTFNIIRPF